MPTCDKHKGMSGAGVDDSFLCPYCEIDKLRGELAQVTKEREQAKMLSERFFEQRNKRNNENATLRKALESVCKGVSLMSFLGSERIPWEAIMEEALQNAKEKE